MIKGGFLVEYPIPRKNPHLRKIAIPEKSREFRKYLQDWGFLGLENPISPSLGLGIFRGFILGIFFLGILGDSKSSIPLPGDFFLI